MYCKKCNNKIEDGEKFCGKCGQKVEVEDNSNNDNVIKVKFNYIIYAIATIIIIVGIVVLTQNMKPKHERVNNLSGYNTSTKQENKGFDVDVVELSNAIIKAQKEIDKDKKYTSSLSSKTESKKDEVTGKDALLYSLEYDNSLTIPPLGLVAGADTKKVYKIYVAMPYSSGTTINWDAFDKELTMLYAGLKIVNKEDLGKNILLMIDSLKNYTSGLEKNYCLNNIYLNESETTVSTKYSYGKYLIFSSIKL